MSDIEKAMLEYGRKVIDLESQLTRLKAENDGLKIVIKAGEALFEGSEKLSDAIESDNYILKAENARYREALEKIITARGFRPQEIAKSALTPVTEGNTPAPEQGEGELARKQREGLKDPYRSSGETR